MQQDTVFVAAGTAASLGPPPTSDKSSIHIHSGHACDKSLRSRNKVFTARQPIVHDQHFCAFCSKPFKYSGSYTEHMKDQCHLRLIKSPVGLGYICRFCTCTSFEDVDTVIRHLWDNHSLDIENLVFHEHCADCYLRNCVFDIQGSANAAFDTVQENSRKDDGGGRENINELRDDTYQEVGYMGNLQCSNDSSSVAVSGHFHEPENTHAIANYQFHSGQD
jgi:hypothetical protein